MSQNGVPHDKIIKGNEKKGNSSKSADKILDRIRRKNN